MSTRPRLKSDLELVLELLPGLREDDLEEVTKQIKALAQFHRRSNVDIQQDYLLQGIFYEVEWMGLGETIPPFFKLKNAKSFNAFGKHSVRIRDMLERHLPDLTLPDKLLLGRLCARILREYMETWCAPDFSGLLANISRLPRAIEDSYPGYLRNGAMRYIIANVRIPVEWRRGTFDDC